VSGSSCRFDPDPGHTPSRHAKWGGRETPRTQCATAEADAASAWKGDHTPRHVHVYRDGKLVVKWDLDNQKPTKGEAPRQVLELIAELVSEGLL